MPEGLLEGLGAYWQILIGVAVAVLAVPLVLRARRRAADLEKALSEGDRQALRDRRGRRVELALTVAVAAIAAAMSGRALMTYAEDVLGLDGYWRLLPFGGLDMAAVVCGIRAQRRARRGEAAGIAGTFVWVLATVSALFSAAEADTLWGAFGRGVWALIATVLWHTGLNEERHASRPDRRMGWVRWLHPIERIQVLAELAADEHISATEATRRVRERRTAASLYRLRLSNQARDAAGERDRSRAQERYRRDERAAQRAASRARLAEPDVLTSVMPQLHVLVDVGHYAMADRRPSATAAATHAMADSAPSDRSSATGPLAESAIKASSAMASQPPVGHNSVADTGKIPASPPSPAPTPAAGGRSRPARRTAEPVSQGATALDTVPQQYRDGSRAPGDAADSGTDPRVLEVVAMLETNPGLSGAEVGRRLGVAPRTGQRLLTKAQDHRRGAIGRRRLKTVANR